MRKRYQVPNEDLEPDIARELTIPLLELDDGDFEAAIKPEDVKDYSEGNKRVLENLSIQSQLIEFLIYAALLGNRQLRAREAAQIRSRRESDKRVKDEAQDRWMLGMVKWGSGVLMTALLLYLFSLLTKK